jgi:hypothetical protein
MGGGGATNTPLYNPALLAIQKQSKLYVNYYNRYSVSELASISGGLYYTNNLLPTGFEITSFGYDQYRESLFRLSAGKQIAERWSLGIALQYALLQSELFETSSGRVSADIGVLYRPIENFLTGLSILHVQSVNVGDKNIENKHITPYSAQLAFNWDIVNAMLITGSITHYSAIADGDQTSVTGSFGMEYIPFEDFKIRVGVKTSPLSPSIGMGYRLLNIDMDVGILYHTVLGVSMGAGISFSF